MPLSYLLRDMPIKSTGDPNAIVKDIRAKADKLHKRLVSALHKAGLEAVTEAREHHRYLAQTGNLQSSVGYCIVDGGRIVDEGGFKPKSGNIGDGAEGSSKGKNFIEQLAAQYSEGLVLIIVAGMSYATYVEAMGLNVLDSAKIKAEEEVREGVKRAVKSVWR